MVCLSVNVRAPGVLSKLQSEMRAGKISDAMWDLYLSRVVQEGDHRLIEAPSLFANGEIQFLVHRHEIRLMRSLELKGNR